MLFRKELSALLLVISHYACTCSARLELRDGSPVLKPRQVATNTFDYVPTNGPLTWFKLPGSAKCKEGRNQSPILLDSSIGQVQPGTLSFNAPKAKGKLENKGTAIEVVEVDGTLRYAGRIYKLVNFHFHTPSEHRINKEHYPIELHIVNKDPADRLLVLGLVIQLSTNRSNNLPRVALAKVSQIAPGQTIETDELDFSEVTDYVRTKKLYRYGGSLTTPPCTEGVDWFVGTEPIYLGVETYNALKAAVKYNSRIIQNAPGKTNVIEVACGAGY
jgi:carbonic anhydrase